MNSIFWSRIAAAFGVRSSLRFGAFILALVLPLAAWAVPALSVTPASLPIDSTSDVVLQVSGLTDGETVRIERYLDLNANGTIDATDRLLQSFLVTDGTASLIGGQAYTAKPGDEDATVNGQLTTRFSIPGSPELARAVGAHLIRVSSPTAAFSSFGQTCTVTQTTETQSIAGTVTSDGTTPVPFAMVGVLVAGGDGDYVRGVVANASGQFSVNLPVGSFQLLPVAQGFVASFDSPAVTLTSGQASAGNVVTLIPATRTISGHLTDRADSAVRLPGVQFFVQSQNGRIAIPVSGADGSFSATVTPGEWEIEVAGQSLAALGYVSPRNAPVVDTSTANVTGVVGEFDRANALIHGTVTSSLGAPLANVLLYAQDTQQNYEVETATDALGRFSLGVRAGDWQVQPENQSPGLVGYIAPSGQQVSAAAGEAALVNFVASAANAHLRGIVANNGMPVANVRVGASPENGEGGLFIQTTTNGAGEFDLAVVGGAWRIQLENSAAQEMNLVSQNLSVTVANNATASGLALAVKSATGVLQGQVSDANDNPISGSNVYGFTNIGGIAYSAGSQTDGSGHYSFPVIAGTWTVGVNTSTLTFENQSAVVSGPSTTVNFSPLVLTSRFQGTVTNNGTPVAGVQLSASPANGGPLFFQATTNASGQFDLAVPAGNWTLRVQDNSLASLNVVAETLNNRAIADDETVSGLSIRLQAVTGAIGGTVRDYSGNTAAGVFVSGNVTVGGVTYSRFVQTNSSGVYSLPAINGVWNVQPNSQSLRFASRNVTVSGSATADFNATVFNQQPSNLTVAAGGNGSFNVSAVAPSGAVALQWQLSANGGESWSAVPATAPYSGPTSSLLLLTAIPIELNGVRYRCVATGDFGTENSVEATLTVDPAAIAPAFTQAPIDATVSLGQSATFIVTVTGTPAPTLQWQRSTDDGFNWVPLSNDATHSGVGTDALTVVTSQATQSGDRYRAIATNSVTSVSSQHATLTLRPDLNLWKSTYFTSEELANPAVSGDGAIYGADGLTNLLKYALGLNPKVDATTGLPVAGTTASEWTYTYQRPSDRSDLSYVVEVSSNLTSWTTEGVTHVLVTSAEGTETWRATYPLAGHANAFFRLKVAPATPPAG